MQFPRLNKAKKTAGSIKELCQIVSDHKKLSPERIVALRKGKKTKEEWLQAIKTESDGIVLVTEKTIVTSQHPDLRRILSETEDRVTLEKPIAFKCSIKIKAKKPKNLKKGLDSPYVLAQIVDNANFGQFRANISIKYRLLVEEYFRQEESKRDPKYTTLVDKLNKIIEVEHIALQNRAGWAAKREFSLDSLVSYRKVDRVVSGIVAVAGTVLTVGSAVVSIASVVLSLGGTAIAAGFAVHGAITSIISTGNLLGSFVSGYQNSIKIAEKSLLTVRACADGVGKQKATGLHVESALLEQLIGDIANPYKNAKKAFKNADYKIGLIEVHLRDMATEIASALDLIVNSTAIYEDLGQKLKLLTAETTDKKTLNSIVAMRQQCDTLKATTAGLEASLDAVLTQVSNTAAPIRDTIPKLKEIQAQLLEFEPTMLASGLGLGIKVLSGAIKAGIGFAVGSPEGLNMAAGKATTEITAASYSLSGLTVGLAVTGGVWEYAKGQIESTIVVDID